MPAHRDNATSQGGCGDKATTAILSGLLALALPMAGCASPEGIGMIAEDALEDSVSVISLKTEAEIPTDGSPLNLIDIGSLWSKRDMDATYDKSSSTTIALDGKNTSISENGKSSVSASGNKLTISQDGTYVLTGKSEDLTVVIDAPKEAKVQLVLAGVTINRDGYAGICAKSADKVFLTIAEGTKNSVISAGDFSSSDDSVDGAIFSKCDLTVNGSGKLTVSAESAHGIVCKDDLKLIASDTEIKAGQHAIQAKDSVSVKDGTWRLTGGQDAIHTENDEDQTLGWAYVEGGSLVLTAGTDGIDSGSWLQIDGGQFVINAEDDAMHAELDLAVNGGTIDIQSCQEGIEGGTVTITDGDVSIVSSDDGINATGDPNNEGDGNTRFFNMGNFGNSQQGKQDNKQVNQDDTQVEGTQETKEVTHPRNQGNQQEEQLVARPDGGKQTSELQGNGGTTQNQPDDMTIPPTDESGIPTAPPDGFDGMTPPDGMTFPDAMRPDNGDGEPSPDENVPSSESGVTSSQRQGGRPDETPAESDATGTDDSQEQSSPDGKANGFASMMMEANDTAIVTVAGGRVVVDAQGDGIDSNGTVHFTGGETYVYGPVSEMNTALDYGTDMRIDGGTVVAVGSAGMVEEVSSASKQPSMTVFLDEDASGDVRVTDGEAGIIRCFPTRGYSAVTVSTPKMAVGGEYKLICGGTSQVVQIDGITTTSGTKGRKFGDDAGFTGEARQPRDGFSRPEDLVGRKFGTGKYGNQGNTE